MATQVQNSWTRLFTFDIVLTPRYKSVYSPFSHWVNSRTDLSFLTLVWQPLLKKENSEFKLAKVQFKTDLVSPPGRKPELDKNNVVQKVVSFSEINFFCGSTLPLLTKLEKLI